MINSTYIVVPDYLKKQGYEKDLLYTNAVCCIIFCSLF